MGIITPIVRKMQGDRHSVTHYKELVTRPMAGLRFVRLPDPGCPIVESSLHRRETERPRNPRALTFAAALGPLATRLGLEQKPAGSQPALKAALEPVRANLKQLCRSAPRRIMKPRPRTAGSQ
jgi:hypothetical protein